MCVTEDDVSTSVTARGSGVGVRHAGLESLHIELQARRNDLRH